MITLPVLWGISLWGEIRINGFVQLVTNAGRVRSQKWCSSWGQSDFFSHFHSIAPNGATISQCERLFSCCSFSVVHIKYKCCSPFEYRHFCYSWWFYYVWPSAVVVVQYNSVCNNLLRRQKMGRRKGRRGKGGEGLRQWKQTLVATSDSAQLCYATSRQHLDFVS